MGRETAVRTLKTAEPLKAKLLCRPSNSLKITEEWPIQKELQIHYQHVLVIDLEYALDKKVEQDLWNLCFKNFFSTLQEQARNKQNPHRQEAQTLLTSFLESASGFYLSLLQDLCYAYDLDLPYRKRNVIFGKIDKATHASSSPQQSSCLYIVQYCLIHLGDIARYRHQRKQAESFYKRAITVSPHCGHPYNQLALLEASQGDRFTTVFQYVRSIAVKNPFPAGATNLSYILTAAIETGDNLTEVQTKMSLNEFMCLFLKAHGLLHTDTDLRQADLCVKSITSTLTALVATQSFTSEKLIKMTIINLYALKNTVGENIMNTEELTNAEKIVRGLILDLLAGSLSAFLLPVYTLKTDESFLDYYALPAIKLIFMWIKNQPMILTDAVFSNRMQIWPSYCKLLNSLQTYIKDHDYSKYLKTPLSYDRDLQGFLPLHNTFKIYDYDEPEVEYSLEKNIRAYRLVEFGKWLTNYNVNGKKLIICNQSENEKVLHFEPGCTQSDPTVKLLEEMKSFKITDENKLKNLERRGGILKPQGSLEKSREERVQVKLQNNENICSQISTKQLEVKPNKRVTQNVALQSIYRKLEENKQVKFSAETTEKEKEKTSPKVKPLMQRQQLMNPPSQAATYQMFNQPPPIEKPDFINFPPAPPHPNMDRSLPVYNNQPAKQLPQNVQFNHNIPAPNMYNSNFNNIIEKPMTFNVPPPPIYNNYNKEERQQNPPWWPNHIPPNPMGHNKLIPPNSSNLMGSMNNGSNSINQSNNLMASNLGSNNIPNNSMMGGNSKMGLNQTYQQPDFFKYNQQFSNNSPNDLFNSSWNGMPRSNNQANVYPPPNTRPLNMRQAMLNETKQQGGGGSGLGNNNGLNNAPGYSLFNTSSWSPAIPGQLRNNSNPDMRQQSLFSGSGPKSLQQLLEQQKQLHNGDS